MRFLLLIALSFLVVSPALAQEEKADATYDRRVELAKEMHEIWPVRLKVEKALDRAAHRVPLQKRAAFKSAMRHAIKYELLEEDSINAMVKTFTVEELEAMVAFYGSPNGRSISAKIESYQNEISPSFTRMMDKALMDVKTGSTPGDIQ